MNRRQQWLSLLLWHLIAVLAGLQFGMHFARNTPMP
jgi:hypothetical protein